MLCKHERAVLLADGWFCPDCGAHFTEKPKKPKAEQSKEPKKAEPKKVNKSTAKK